MHPIIAICALVAFTQPAIAQLQISADGQMTPVAGSSEPAYLRYDYVPVDCVVAPCPNYFVLAADTPAADGIVVWSGDDAPIIEGPAHLVERLKIVQDGPVCWVIEGSFTASKKAPTLRVDAIVDDCN